MNDKRNMRPLEKEHLGMTMQSTSELNLSMRGDITDRIFKDGKFVEERVGHNLVVNSFLPLVMSLLKIQSGISGIQYWAVGSGASSWDTSMPNPEPTATQLTLEIGRVAITPSEISFLNSSYDVVTTPTNIIQIKHIFGSADCNGVWREFGIFGGNATASANSGMMINKRHHDVLTKTSDMTIERTMRFTLTLT